MARDFSLAVNVQFDAMLLSTTTLSCVPCGVGFTEVVPCTSTTAAVCQRQGTRSCASGWVFGGSSLCYLLLPGPLTPEDGATACSELAGGLAVAYTSVDATSLADVCTADTGCWLGAATAAGGSVPTWTSAFSVTAPHDAWVPSLLPGIGISSDAECAFVLDGTWALDACTAERAVVCARAATIGVRSVVKELVCSTPGCTASETVSGHAEAGATVTAATLSVVVEQLDMALPSQFVQDLYINSSRIASCPGGSGGDRCSSDVWRSCAAPLSVAVDSHDVHVSARVTDAVATSCTVNDVDDGVVFRARARVDAASVHVPSEVFPRVSAVSGGAVTVAWDWPADSGGAGLDKFQVSFGTDTATVVLNTPRNGLTNALRHSEQVMVSSTDSAATLTATCSLGKVVMWGFSLHVPLAKADATACVLLNNKACKTRQATCQQTACAGSVRHDDYRVVYVVCQTPDAVPAWAAASNQRLVDSSPGGALSAACLAGTGVLFGFSYSRGNPAWSASEQTCALSRTFSCSPGQTTCVQPGCAASTGTLGLSIM